VSVFLISLLETTRISDMRVYMPRVTITNQSFWEAVAGESCYG